MNTLEKINEIEAASGNEKLEKMRQYSCLKSILRYTYDPFKKYHITAPDLDGVLGGSNFTMETKYILESLTSRGLSGQAALEKVCDHIMSLNPESAEVFKRMLNKDLRCGVNIKSVNKVFPGLIPLVWDGSQKPAFALCKTFDQKKAKYPIIAAIKKDGVRGQKIDKMISRQGMPLVGHDHIEKVLDDFPVDLDGELCVPGLEFDDASGLIRNSKPTPDSVFWVFDAPSLGGSKWERYQWLKKRLPLAMTESRVALIQHYWIEDEKALFDLYILVVMAKEEGLVIYSPDSEYEDGRIWWRLVPIKSEDLKVIGFYEGKGKHVGSLGGIIVDYKGHKVKVGTGFSEKILNHQLNQLVSTIDKKLLTSKSKSVAGYSIEEISPLWHKIRQFIWDNKHLFLNLVAKIEYKEKTKAGSLRHPRFKTWRFDKS